MVEYCEVLIEIVSPYFAINSINASELKDKNYFYMSVVKHKSIMGDCQLPKRWGKIKELHEILQTNTTP